MFYVQRDKDGKIKGVYANPQPQPDGTTITDSIPLPDDSAEVIAYRNPPPPAPSEAHVKLTAVLADPTVPASLKALLTEIVP